MKDHSVRASSADGAPSLQRTLSEPFAASAPAGDAVAWLVERKSDRTFPRFYASKADADRMANIVTVSPAATVIPLYARPPAPAVEVREAKRLINERLEDLQTANALYGKDQRLSAPDKVARNDREISWLKDLRSYLSASPREMGLKSDGGVDGHAAVPPEIPTQRSGESRDPLGDGSVKVGPHREDAAGIKPGPSEPSPSSRSETAWQPIETAPHNTSVLLGWRDWRDGQWCVEVGAATTGQRYDNGYSNISQHGSATHWQSLPSEGPL